METNEIMYVRVLQHEAESDGIRIGRSYPISDLEKEVENVKKAYDQRLEWCGGFDNSCGKYYQRIAIVDAETLAVLKVIFSNKEE